MERRVLVAVFLSFLVLYAYQAFFVPPPPASDKAAQQTAPSQAAKQSAAAQSPAPAATPSATPAAEPQALIAETAEREISIETATVQAVVSNRGGRLVHWRLKNYRDDQGNPVDLIPSSVPLDQAFPFQLRLDDEQLTRRISSALYR